MSVKISALVHETQKERGMTAGFLGSGGKNFGDMQVRATMYATEQEMREAKQRLERVIQEAKRTEKRQSQEKAIPVKRKAAVNCSDNLPSDPVKRSQAMAECEQNKFDADFD